MKYIKQVLFLVGCCGSAFAQQQKHLRVLTAQVTPACVDAVNPALCDQAHQARGDEFVKLAIQYQEQTQTAIPGITTYEHVKLGNVETIDPNMVNVPVTWAPVGDALVYTAHPDYPERADNLVTIKSSFLEDNEFVSTFRGLKTDRQNEQNGAIILIGTDTGKLGIFGIIDHIQNLAGSFMTLEGNFFGMEAHRKIVVSESTGLVNQEMNVTLQRKGTSFSIYVNENITFFDEEALTEQEKIAIKLVPSSLLEPSELITSFKTLTTYKN